MRFIPPEAYTTKELAQAYAWLQNQPESVQKVISNNKEALVSLYKKVMRGGSGEIASHLVKTGASSETFRSDLKNLAHGLKQFEDPNQEPIPKPEPVVQHEPPTYQPFQASETTHRQGFEFDEKSWEMIQTVKSEFNLSSDSEATRLLIALGFDRASSIFPKSKLQI